MAHVIAEPCIGVKDTACVDVCPVDCIYGDNEDWPMLYIQPEECVDCTLCVYVCPVGAIFHVDDLPERWADYAAENRRRFGLPAS